MTRKLSAVQAKSQLADCLRKAESGEPVIITRHGKPVAAIVAVDRVAFSKGRHAAPDAGLGGLGGLAGGWKGSEDLVKALAKVRRTRSRRPVTLD
jgi:prevent-host-death family protein